MTTSMRERKRKTKRNQSARERGTIEERKNEVPLIG